MKEHGVLGYTANGFANALLSAVLDILSIEQNATSIGVVEAEKQPSNGTLASTG